MKYLKLALGFLTVIPVNTAGLFQPGDLGRAAAFYSLVGFLLGIVLCAARFLFGKILPDPLGAVLVVTVWAGLTGGLHLDGLADCCDGLLAAAPPERRLEIMRDPRLGAFGGIGLVLFLFLKVSSVMAAVSPELLLRSGMALLLAPTLARWLILLAARQPMARPGGLGAEFAIGVKWHTYFAAGLLPLALVFLGGLHALAAVLLSALVVVFVMYMARKRLGGMTGDVLGLLVELSELIVLLAFAAFPGPLFPF